jgi:hypothetical protein
MPTHPPAPFRLCSIVPNRRCRGLSAVIAAGLLAACAGPEPVATPGDPPSPGPASAPAEPVSAPEPASAPAPPAPDPMPTPIRPPAPDPAPAPAPDPDPAPAPAPVEPPAPAASPAAITLAPGLVVRPAAGERLGSVELAATACLDAGWLEQVVCGVGTREHESLLVIEIRAADLHAAMLLAGLTPGRPGRWSVDDRGRTRLEAPSGDPVAISFQWTDEAGRSRSATPRDWIISEDGERRLDAPRWLFGGSRLIDADGRLVDDAAGARGEPAAPDGVRYLADLTGSIIGLVTFGDEVIGLETVIPDATDYAEPAWMVDTAAVPPPGTPVTIRIERAAAAD